jgi:sugar/nucleoside kinase (ribokinase family)
MTATVCVADDVTLDGRRRYGCSHHVEPGGQGANVAAWVCALGERRTLLAAHL